MSRARLSAYSGFTAGFFRLHAQPTWVVAAFDVAAVALVVGTLHVLGTIASGKGVPDIIPPAEANVPGDTSVIAETTVPHVTVRERGLATASDHSLLFSDPVVFNPYLQSLPGAPSTGSFTGGEAETAATEQPVPAQPPVSALPPSAEIAPALLSYTGVTAGKVARTAKRLVPAAGKALDELMPGGRSVVSSLTAATDLDGSVSLAPSRVHVAAGPADLTADVSHAATTVAGVAGATTKTVGNAVGTVAGAASGAVGGVTHSAFGGGLH